MIPKILSGMTTQEISNLNPQDCNRKLSTTELEMIFKACNALWHHPGKKNPTAPHAILTSGKHSNIYVNCPQVLQRSNLCQIMAKQLFFLLRSVYTGPIDWVTGSDSSALGISKDIANIAQAKWHPMQKGPNKSQIWEKALVSKGEMILQVEELLTTGLTTKFVRNGIRKGNPHEVSFIPFIPLLVHRPDKNVPRIIDGSELVYLLHYDTYVVDPEKDECALCAKGSQALPAKENWEELTSTM